MMTGAFRRVLAGLMLSALLPLTSAAVEAWALVRVAVANVRENPSHAAEMGTQVLMGTPLKVESSGKQAWLKVETPEGYKGYVAANSLHQLSPVRLQNWKSSDRVVVTAVDQTWVYSPDIVSGDDSDLSLCRVSDVVNGCILQIAPGASIKGFVRVVLPDGREAFASCDDVEPLQAWADRECSMQAAIDFARAMTGTAYLWGGTSSKGADCSGLTKAAFLSQGIILPRNASQQARIGEAVSINDVEAFMPGDLLFFGNLSTGRVNHVGISLGGARFIHSSGRVRVSSLRPGDADYEAISLLGACRLTTACLEKMALKNHRWYF